MAWWRRIVHSYSVRNLVAFLLALVLSSFTVGTFQYFALDRKATESDRLAVIRLNSSFSQKLEQAIREQFRMVTFLASTNYPATALRFGLFDEFYSVAENLNWKDGGLLLIDNAGTLRSHYGLGPLEANTPLPEPFPIRNHPHLIRHDQFILLITPFRGEQGKIIGYLAGILPIEKIRRTLTQNYREQTANFSHLKPSVDITFDGIDTSQAIHGTSGTIANVRFSMSDPKRIWISLVSQSTMNAIIPTLIVAVAFLLYIRRSLSAPVDQVLNIVAAVRDKQPNLENLALPLDPSFRKIATSLLDMHRKRLALEEENQKRAIASRVAAVAAQVAHDIRSPLTALEAAVTSAGAARTDEWKSLMRSALTRIKDITNDLYARKSDHSQVERDQHAYPHLLVGILEDIVSEKRLRLRDRHGIQVTLEFPSSSMQEFVQVPAAELKRVISNILENSIESITESGQISVNVISLQKNVLVKVVDSGLGIPDHILPTLGQRGVSFGKSHGSGLGLAYCCEKLQEWGGALIIQSKLGIGTTVEVTLPRGTPPPWFPSDLTIPKHYEIIVVDDDLSIHQMWHERLTSLGNQAICHFSSIDDLDRWLARFPDHPNRFYLIDHEFSDQGQTGFDFIQRMHGKDRAVLVTSHFENPRLISECTHSGIKLLPKVLCGTFPINVTYNSNLETMTSDVTILIDDDRLVRLTWEKMAKVYGRKVIAFPSIDAFLREHEHLSRESQIYLDVHLGNSVRGSDYGQVLADLGFRHIFLATAYNPDTFGDQPWCCGVVGKDPPWPSSTL